MKWQLTSQKKECQGGGCSRNSSSFHLLTFRRAFSLIQTAWQEAAHAAQSVPQEGCRPCLGAGGGAACRGPPRLSFERESGSGGKRIPLTAPGPAPASAGRGKAALACPRVCRLDVVRRAWRSDGLEVGSREGRTINSPG